MRNLKKNYKDIEAVKGISFAVDKNTFFAFLGPNGAGKSTTINIISTLLDKNSGEIEVMGNVLGKDDAKIRKLIGVVFQNSMLDDLLTVKENLLVRASFYNIGLSEFHQRIEEINEFIEIKSIYGQ